MASKMERTSPQSRAAESARLAQPIKGQLAGKWTPRSVLCSRDSEDGATSPSGDACTPGVPLGTAR
ncbi:MAG: hypothetical protein M3O50_12500, partial [Myxococcota bacterium]|nr:hypothetical protein [Myxococcota bacterium]